MSMARSFIPRTSTLLLCRMLLQKSCSMSNSSPIPTLKALRETPTVRIYAVGASGASLVELLGAVLGNPDTALAVLSQFPTLEDIVLQAEMFGGARPE